MDLPEYYSTYIVCNIPQKTMNLPNAAVIYNLVQILLLPPTELETSCSTTKFPSCKYTHAVFLFQKNSIINKSTALAHKSQSGRYYY
jgi:hypothetical protein